MKLEVGKYKSTAVIAIWLSDKATEQLPRSPLSAPHPALYPALSRDRTSIALACSDLVI